MIFNPVLILLCLRVVWCRVESVGGKREETKTILEVDVWNWTYKGNPSTGTNHAQQFEDNVGPKQGSLLKQLLLNRHKRQNVKNNQACPSRCRCFFPSNGTYQISCKTFSQLAQEIPIPHNATHITGLIIKDSFLQQVPKNLCELPALASVDFSRNSIRTINPGTFSCLQETLKSINVSRNHIAILSGGVFDHLSKLETLDLSRNAINVVEPLVFVNTVPCKKGGTWLSNLKYVHMEHNNLKSNEMWGLVLPRIEVFNLSYNQMDHFSNAIQLNMNSVASRHATLDSTHNQFELLSVESLKIYNVTDWYDFLELWKYRFDYTHNPLFCDCNMYSLGSVMKRIWGRFFDDPIFHLTCARPQNLAGKEISNEHVLREMNCRIHANCPLDTHCAYYPHRNATVVKADTFSTHINLPDELPMQTAEKIEIKFQNVSLEKISPRWYFSESASRISLLDVSMNAITAIEPNDFNQLMKVDVIKLQNNRMEGLPKNMQNFSGSSIDLRNNPLKCSCDMLWVSVWIEDNTEKIVDSTKLFCVNGREKIRLVELNSRLHGKCNINYFLVLSISLGGVLAILVIAIALICKFHLEIRVIWFARETCRFACCKDDKSVLDCHKLFDVDIAVHINDVGKVQQLILPTLEGHTPPFIACLEYRDFLFINDKEEHIINAVNLSSCTLLLLTKDFCNDAMCRFQFTQAFKRSVQDKQHKVIIITFTDDVKRLNLNNEMKAYLSTQKYLRASDRLFKKKLLYELPHVPLKSLWKRHKFRPIYPKMFRDPLQQDGQARPRLDENTPLLLNAD